MKEDIIIAGIGAVFGIVLTLLYDWFKNNSRNKKEHNDHVDSILYKLKKMPAKTSEYRDHWLDIIRDCDFYLNISKEEIEEKTRTMSFKGKEFYDWIESYKK